MKREKGYSDDEIIIRSISKSDIDVIAGDLCLPWSTVQESKEKWNNYYREQQTGIRTVGIVEQDGKLLGYGSLLLKSQYPYLAGLPEIHDVWIYEEYRKRGIGSQLIDWLEKLAKEKGYKEVGIGVGLYADYGSAQKLYIRLGYIPDGRGISYKYQSTIPGESYPLDDDLILWLKKDLYQSEKRK